MCVDFGDWSDGFDGACGGDNNGVVLEDVDILEELFDFEGGLVLADADDLAAVVEFEEVRGLHGSINCKWGGKIYRGVLALRIII